MERGEPRKPSNKARAHVQNVTTMLHGNVTFPIVFGSKWFRAQFRSGNSENARKLGEFAFSFSHRLIRFFGFS